MPFADPTSVYLENLARRRAQAEMYGQQFRDASEGIGKGLGQWDSAMRLQKADAAKAEAAKAEAEQTAFKNDIETRGLRIREAQEKREADEAARIAAARPGEEARAAEDRAFTVRKREMETDQAARKAAIERIQSLPSELEFGDDVDVASVIEQIGAEGGLSSDEALGVYRQAQQAKTDAARAARLKGDLTQAQIDKMKRRPSGDVKPERADPLRKEFNALPEVKNYTEASVAFDKMQRAASSSSPAGDLSLIFNLMKTLDPTSTVRESEFAAAARAGDFGDQIATAVTRITSGERLTAAQRADFMKQAAGFLAAHRSAYDRASERYSALASGRKVPTTDVVGVAPPSQSTNAAPSFESVDEFAGD